MFRTIRLFLFLFFICLNLTAQIVSPVTRFHEQDSPYKPYFDNFLSGFMQTAPESSTNNGFLQMPYIGDPVLIYIGEKDSTQFMAYASGYEFLERRPDLGKYSVKFIRYGITADITAHPAYVEHCYTFPDTLADKGFLMDVDHAGGGAGNEDMDIVFVDRQTIRAYKRSLLPLSGTPEQYYVAHFSHPFKTWNVRREIVRSESGNREARCKVAFTFDLKKGEQLKVVSAVSLISTDKAFKQVDGLPSYAHVSDKRRPIPSSQRDNLIAENKPSSSKAGTAISSKSPIKSEKSTEKTFNSTTEGPKEIFEISTRDAELKTAFYAVIARLKEIRACREAKDAQAFLEAITPYYLSHARANLTNPLEADSLLKAETVNILTKDSKSLSLEQAAWYVFNALGFCPAENEMSYRIVRPLFNVATLNLPKNRRFILHTKGNTEQSIFVKSAKLFQEVITDKLLFTKEQMLRGGILEIRMSKQENS